MLRGYIECSLRWLQTGCLRWSGPLPGRSLRQPASRAATDACCTSPLDFSGQARPPAGDTREHRELRSTFSKILVLYNSVQDLRNGVIDGTGNRPAGALRIESARIVLPDPACVITLDDWLPESIVQSLIAPAAPDQPISPSVFNVSMHQWRSVVRRMVRCKLAIALPSDTAPFGWLLERLPCPRIRIVTASSVTAGLKTVKGPR